MKYAFLIGVILTMTITDGISQTLIELINMEGNHPFSNVFIIAVENDSIVINSQNTQYKLAINNIDYIRLRHDSNVAVGIFGGTILGAGVFSLLADNSESIIPGVSKANSDLEKPLLITMGALIGGFLGILVTSEYSETFKFKKITLIEREKLLNSLKH